MKNHMKSPRFPSNIGPSGFSLLDLCEKRPGSDTESIHSVPCGANVDGFFHGDFMVILW